MNQKTIGQFIAACRKEKGLTQTQVAEKLNITNRAVSKWETGKSIPDAAIMLDLCEILGISVNELLSGERIAMENYQKRAEENLVELQRKTTSAQKSLNFIIKLVIPIVGVLFVVKYGIGSTVWNFIDFISLEFILVPCLLVLLCTGYGPAFLRAFVYVVKRDKCTSKTIKESMKALKLVCCSSLLWGSIGFTIAMVNLLKYSDVDASAVGKDISVALITVFYALVVNAVLVPVYFELNRLKIQ